MNLNTLTLAAIALLSIGLSSLAGCADPPPPQCRGTSSTPAASAEVVCAKLTAINCPITGCPAAYSSWRATVEPATFDRVTACYMAATNCREVNDCSRACGNGGGPVVSLTDGAVLDVNQADVMTQDVPNTDEPNTDAPNMDAPNMDVLNTDVPNTDVPNTDVPASDAALTDGAADSA